MLKKKICLAAHTYPTPGNYIACVKVINTFGCGTSTIIEVEV